MKADSVANSNAIAQLDTKLVQVNDDLATRENPGAVYVIAKEVPGQNFSLKMSLSEDAHQKMLKVSQPISQLSTQGIATGADEIDHAFETSSNKPLVSIEGSTHSRSLKPIHAIEEKEAKNEQNDEKDFTECLQRLHGQGAFLLQVVSDDTAENIIKFKLNQNLTVNSPLIEFLNDGLQYKIRLNYHNPNCMYVLSKTPSGIVAQCDSGQNQAIAEALRAIIESTAVGGTITITNLSPNILKNIQKPGQSQQHSIHDQINEFIADPEFNQNVAGTRRAALSEKFNTMTLLINGTQYACAQQEDGSKRTVKIGNKVG